VFECGCVCVCFGVYVGWCALCSHCVLVGQQVIVVGVVFFCLHAVGWVDGGYVFCVAQADSAAPWQELVCDALGAMFRDAADSAHYTNDYSTKGGPVIGDVLGEQARGIEGLRRDEDATKLLEGGEVAGAPRGDAVLESARRTAIRMSTSANRALLKKLPEMVFQMRYGHECYESHKTWTLFCKGPVALALTAAHAVRTNRSDIWEDAACVVEEDAPGDADDEEPGVMDAIQLRGRVD
jgi:hypothetical protein